MPATKQRHPRVSVTKRGYGKCPSCGQRSERRIVFWQSVMVTNRNSSGVAKTRDEILDELNEKARAWRPDFLHEGCISAKSGRRA